MAHHTEAMLQHKAYLHAESRLTTDPAMAAGVPRTTGMREKCRADGERIDQHNCRVVKVLIVEETEEDTGLSKKGSGTGSLLGT